jgi:NADH-quinone oxidoreductase subunit A
MFDGFYNVFWFLIIGVAFVLISLGLSTLIRPSDPMTEKLLPYECGEESSGTGFVRFNPRFYVIGLVFLIFDIETVFIFPWAVILKGAGAFVLIEMVVFLAILVVGLVYAWGKRDLEWIRQPTQWQSVSQVYEPPLTATSSE